MPGSATEGWHQRVLFIGDYAGREPHSSSRLSAFGWFDLGKRILALIFLNDDFLRAIGNICDLHILLYHNKEIESGGSQNSELRSLRWLRFPHIDVGRHAPVSIDFGYLSDPSLVPSFLIPSGHDLRGRCGPWPFDPIHPICLSSSPPALT